MRNRPGKPFLGGIRGYVTTGITLLLPGAGCATHDDPGGPVPAQRSNTAGEIAQGLQATVIDVDPTNVQGAVARTLFGVNHRYVNNARGTWNPTTQDCAPAFNTAVDYMSPSVMRYPGGLIANLFDWRRAIGTSRKNQVVYPFYAPNVSTQPCNFGIHEAMNWAAAHGMRTSYVFGVANATVQDAADLVEYLNAPNDGSNRGGGVDYAARRAANGHPAPFNVHLFELGNEPNVDPNIVDERYWMAADRSLTACPGHEPCYARQYALGDTVEFTNRQPVVADDDWSDATSYSNGAAGQKKYTRYRPVVSDTILRHESPGSRSGKYFRSSPWAFRRS
jgi:alpha-L-arabinofuranosidase